MCLMLPQCVTAKSGAAVSTTYGGKGGGGRSSGGNCDQPYGGAHSTPAEQSATMLSDTALMCLVLPQCITAVPNVAASTTSNGSSGGRSRVARMAMQLAQQLRAAERGQRAAEVNFVSLNTL